VSRGKRIQDLSPVTDTRLRLVRRLVFATIVILGIGFALIQFPSVKRVATGVLASSAVVGLVVGFAARQTLANGIAGILLAITQPIRIGDLVTFEGQTGEVEDVRLTYTYIRLDDGRRLIVPNERLASSSIENHTVVDPRVQVEVSVWLPPGADLERALELATEHRLQRGRPLDEPFALDDRQVCQSHGAAGRVSGVGRGVHELRVRRRLLERPLDGVADHDAAKWKIGARDPFRERHEVRLDTPVVQREPPSRPPEPGDDLVGNQEHLVPVRDRAQLGPVVVRRRDHAARALDGLADDRGYGVRLLLEECLLQRRGVIVPLGVAAGARSLSIL
jgi:hypothetical protein